MDFLSPTWRTQRTWQSCPAFVADLPESVVAMGKSGVLGHHICILDEDSEGLEGWGPGTFRKIRQEPYGKSRCSLGFEAVMVTFPIGQCTRTRKSLGRLVFIGGPESKSKFRDGKHMGNIMQLRVFHCGERGCQTVNLPYITL